MRRIFRSFFRARILAGGIILGALFISVSIFFFRPDRSSLAEWWDDTFRYRQAVSITNSSGSNLSDYEMSITLDTATLITAGKMQSDCDDIRVTDKNGAPLPYWIEENSQVCNTSATRIWVKHPSIPTTGSILYVYYGNTTVSSQSNGKNTFQFFDNFSDDTLSGEYLYGGGTIAESSGSVSLINNADAWDTYYFLNNNYSRTLVMQARFRAASGTRSMIGWHDSGTGASHTDLVYAIYFNNGTLNVYEDGSNRSVGGHTYTVGNWYDIKIELLSTGAKYYYKASGVDSWTTLYTSAYSSESNLRPGIAHHDATAGEYSYLDDLIVRTYASTEPSFALQGSEAETPGPISYWKFDEGYGTTSNNAVSTDHTATLVSGTSWQTEDQCINGKCLKFDGVNDTVSMGVGNDYFPLNTFSICTWVRTPGLGAGMTKAGIISMTYGLIFELSGSGYFQTTMDNGTTGVTSTISRNLFDNKFHHLCLTYDGTQRHMYIDGVKELSVNTTWLGTTRWPTNGVNLGTNNNNSMYKLNGYMDEVKIYPYARTADQIKSDYVVGSASAGSAAVFGAPDNSALNNGIVGYWKMDEPVWNGTGGEVIDWSSAGNHGTRGGNATTAAGKFGNGGTFDGGGDYVTIPGSSTLDQQDLTIVSWNIASNYDANMFMFEKTTNGSVNTQYSLFYDTGGSSSRVLFRTVGLSPQDLTVADSAAGPSTNQWNMIVATYSSSTGTKKIYINGVLAATQTGVTGTIATNPAGTSWIGTYGGGVGYAFNGRIDETRVYNRALSDSEVQDLYRWSPGPIGHWNFDESTGTSANDRSGNGNTGTLGGGNAAPSWLTGVYGTALQFDGSNDTVTVNDVNMLDLQYGITVTAWIKPTGFPSDSSSNVTYQIVSKRSAWSLTGIPYELSIGHNDGVGGAKRFITFRTAGNSSYTNYENVITENVWQHVAGTWDGAVTRVYVNGVFIGQNNQPNSVTNNATNVLIGALPTGGETFNGAIDDVRIYNYARTQEQVLQDMGASAVAGANTEPLPAPVAHYSFDEGYGTTANDSSQFSRTVTRTGSTLPQWSQEGKSGKSLLYDGASSYATTSPDPVNSLQEMSLSAWVKVDPTDTTGPIAGNVFGHYYRYGLVVTSGVYRAFFRSGGGTGVLSSLTSYSGGWDHVLMTYNNGATAIYVNGDLKASGTFAYAPLTQSTNTINIGTHSTAAGDWFKGNIDEVKIYNVALTPEQVRIDYNEGHSQVLGSLSTDSDGSTPSSAASREYCVPGDTASCSNPIAEWKLDENTGATAYNTIGNGNNGTLSGDAVWSSGVNGSGIKFDGTSDFVDVGDIAAVDNTDLTVSFWAKVSDLANDSVFFSKGAHSTNQPILIWYDQTVGGADVGSANTSTISILSYDGAIQHWVAAPTNTLTDSNWHYYTVFIDNTNNVISLYLDSKLVVQNTKSWNGIQASSNTIKIGGSTTGSSVLEGSMDTVRIYSYIRTPAQIAWEYNKGAPVAHYRFDECEGTTIYNSAISGNDQPVGNNGTLTIGGSGTNTAVGTCATSGAWADGASGKVGASMDFDGTDDQVTFTYDNPSTWTEPFSLSTWINVPSSATWSINGVRGNIVSRGSYDGSHGLVRSSTDNVIQAYIRSATNTNAVSATINRDVWYHTTVTWDGATLTLYLDGIPAGTQANSLGGTPDSGSWNIAGAVAFSGSAGNRYTGQIDDVRLYNYALTAAQVRDIYNNGAVSFK